MGLLDIFLNKESDEEKMKKNLFGNTYDESNFEEEDQEEDDYYYEDDCDDE